MPLLNTNRRRQLAYRLLAILGGLLFAIIICEIFLWTCLPIPSPYRTGLSVSSRNIYVEKRYQPGMTVRNPDPEIMPGTRSPCRFTINNFQFRSPRLDKIAKPVGLTRIFCIGGSTTECLYLDDNDAWPELIQKRLSEAAPSKSFDVVNCGGSGETTRDHLSLLVHRVIAFQPNVVIILAGVNDLSLCLQPDYDILRRDACSQHYFLHPEAESLAALVKIAAGDLSQIDRRIVTYLRSRRTRDERGNWIQDESGRWVHVARVHGTSVPSGELPTKISTEEFGQNLRSIVGVCQAHGVIPILATQPTLMSDSMSARDQWLCARLQHNDSRIRGADYRKVLESFNDITRDVAQKTNSVLVDLAADISGNGRYFYDDCHFNIEGGRRVATIISDQLLNDARVIGRFKTGHRGALWSGRVNGC